MVQVLCPYCIDMSNYTQVIVKCSLNDQYCYNVRFCKEIYKPTMTNNYLQYGCKIKNNYEKDVEMGRRKKITTEVKPATKATTKTKKIIEETKIENVIETKITPKVENVQPKNCVVEPIEVPKEHKKEICVVNYYSRTLKKTSISYEFRGKQYSLFLNGEYHGSVEVEYEDILNNKNIISVRQL